MQDFTCYISCIILDGLKGGVVRTFDGDAYSHMTAADKKFLVNYHFILHCLF